MQQLHYYDFGEGVTAFSTTRRGGYSTGQYGEFNINRYCGDDNEHILQNRTLLCRMLGIEDDRLLMPHQTHDTRVALIGNGFLALSAAEQQAALEGIDAVMTEVPGLCIGVSTADCIPILLYDPEHRAVCAVHAGWRGTVGRIVQKAVMVMTAAYGSRPDMILAQIGPGISLDCFEVGQEVYDAFAAAGFNMSAISRRYPSRPQPSPGTLSNMELLEKWHIDLPACNRLQLLDSGLQQTAITLSGICTYKQHDTFFSARRLGISSGRIFTGIMI